MKFVAILSTLFATAALAQKQYQASGIYSKSTCDGSVLAYGVVENQGILQSDSSVSVNGTMNCMNFGCVSQLLNALGGSEMKSGMSATCTSNKPETEVKEKMGKQRYVLMTLHSDKECGKIIGSQAYVLDQCISIASGLSMKASVKNDDLYFSTYNQSDKCEGSALEVQVSKSTVSSGSCSALDGSFNLGSSSAAAKFQIISSAMARSAVAWSSLIIAVLVSLFISF